MALLSVAQSTIAQSVRAAVRFGGRRGGQLEQLQHVPSNLRTADPSVSSELADGTIGLPSGLLRFGTRDMFAVALEEPSLARDLFSFVWLAHLDAARTEQSERQIRAALLTWARHPARQSDVAAEPAVRARRAMSLLAHADPALAGATHRDFDAITALVADEFADLAREVKRMPTAPARLTAAIALAQYALATGQSEGSILDAERRLGSELQRQIHRDGGPISRNPAHLLDAALDLVPLKQLDLLCRRPLPEAVVTALARIAPMLHVLQMPDRSLARFNGMGATPIGDLLSVMRHLQPGAETPGTVVAEDTGYIRATAGTSVLLVDTGPGVTSMPGETPFAGALSFEFGAGAVSLIVNAGAGREVPPKVSARATAAHSALVLSGLSSAPLVGGRAGWVKSKLETSDGTHTVIASNDGYKVRQGEVHHRTLKLSQDGGTLEGVDELIGTSKAEPYEIHFHLHPSVFVDPAPTRDGVHLRAGDGSVWAFTAEGAEPAIEASIYHAGISGPKPTLQLVLRGSTADTRRITWRLERLQTPAVA